MELNIQGKTFLHLSSVLFELTGLPYDRVGEHVFRNGAIKKTFVGRTYSIEIIGKRTTADRDIILDVLYTPAARSEDLMDAALRLFLKGAGFTNFDSPAPGYPAVILEGAIDLWAEGRYDV